GERRIQTGRPGCAVRLTLNVLEVTIVDAGADRGVAGIRKRQRGAEEAAGAVASLDVSGVGLRRRLKDERLAGAAGDVHLQGLLGVGVGLGLHERSAAAADVEPVAGEVRGGTRVGGHHATVWSRGGPVLEREAARTAVAARA